MNGESTGVLEARMALKEESQGLSLDPVSISLFLGLKRKSSPWIRWWPHYQRLLPRYFLTCGESTDYGARSEVCVKYRKDTWMLPVQNRITTESSKWPVLVLVHSSFSLSFSLQLQHKDVSHSWFPFPISFQSRLESGSYDGKEDGEENQHPLLFPLLLVSSNQINDPYFWQLSHSDSNSDPKNFSSPIPASFCHTLISPSSFNDTIINPQFYDPVQWLHQTSRSTD